MGNNYTTGAFDRFFYGLLLPINIKLSWMADTLNIQWTDIYTPDVFVEVWQSMNGAPYILGGVANPGDTSIGIVSSPVSDVNVKIRIFKDGAFSDFSNPINIPPSVLAGIYVAPTGDDIIGDGSISNPYQTIEKAWTVVAAGDTIYLRGGTYSHAIIGETNLAGKSGTALLPINIYNYPNEKPIIDLSDFVPITWSTAFILTGSYINVRGLRVTGLTQPLDGDYISKGISLGNGCNYVTFEQCEVDHIGGQGFTQETGSTLTNIIFINCDSHHNADPYSDLWGAAYNAGDGFCFGGANNNNILFRGCRSWSNSDDGWDTRNSNANERFENCWSFWNGYREDGITPGGDGIGFKTGGKTSPATTNYLRTLVNCISFQNRVHGFDPQPDAADLWFNSIYYNCVAYDNSDIGFNCIWYASADILRNCISYSNAGDDLNDNATTDDINNSWNGHTVNDSDFKSVLTTGVDGARQAGGGLPLLDFLHLASGSDLINAGVNVGVILDCDGKPYASIPSIGAFEFSL